MSESEEAFQKHACLHSWIRLSDKKIHLKIIISQKMTIVQENYTGFFLPSVSSECIVNLQLFTGMSGVQKYMLK